MSVTYVGLSHCLTTLYETVINILFIVFYGAMHLTWFIAMPAGLFIGVPIKSVHSNEKRKFLFLIIRSISNDSWFENNETKRL